MKIEFYEEFPSEENLKKLKLIPFPTKVFIAAHSIEKFKKFEKIAKSYKKDLELAYWPKVKGSYWVSAFSNTKDLVNLFDSLNSIKDPILIDLELPLKKYWKLYLKNFFFIRKNKKLIKNFLEENKHRITTAEYVRSPLNKFAKFYGLDFDVDTEKSLMHYNSKKSKSNIFVEQEMIKKIRKENLSLSLGLTASGISNKSANFRIDRLIKDLKFAKSQGIKKIIIFRLEGITKELIEKVKPFVKN